MTPSFEDFEPLYSADQLRERIAELGKQISTDLAESDNLVVVCVLKGAIVFMSDLIRYLPHNVTCDFLRLSSYQGGTQSTGTVRFDFDLTQPIKGKDVLIVEDIVDTGLSMHFLLKALSAREPRSLKICTLLDKPARRKREVPISYTGFQIENRFVIGYGLDLEGRYRNLPYIAALTADKQAALDGNSEDALHAPA
ncbi:MAG: hypoxanthine phosphoribosyltransferase [Planctomycetes bacterium]|nr:hypoxanthine phosphoribosyltransferase [Planctomycetota bacterium]